LDAACVPKIFMVIPNNSKPCSASNMHVTELSTPPDIATATVGFGTHNPPFSRDFILMIFILIVARLCLACQ
jgi:hypothetical protein